MMYTISTCIFPSLLATDNLKIRVTTDDPLGHEEDILWFESGLLIGLLVGLLSMNSSLILRTTRSFSVFYTQKWEGLVYICM